MASEEEEPVPTWPPLYSVVYSIEEQTSHEYFPLELGNADYAARILRYAGHAIREAYKSVKQDALAPPYLEDGRIVEAQAIDNRRLFGYALSAKLPSVFAKVLRFDVESLIQQLKILSLAEADMMKAPLPKYWTQVKVRRLFDAGLRVVEAAARAGFGQWASLNLSGLRNQYKSHMAYRDQRLQTACSFGVLNPSNEDGPFDEGWAVDEDNFWRPPSPEGAVKSRFQQDRDHDEDHQRQMATAKREQHLQRIEQWESLFVKLPRMDKTRTEDGLAERLRIAVETRLKLVHDVNSTREAEARAKRQRQYTEADLIQSKLNKELLPKLREFESLALDLWKAVTPAELVDTAAVLEHEAHEHAQDAANARDYIMARNLSSAKDRLAAARATLDQRRSAANIMEEMATRGHAITTMRESVKEVVRQSNNLKKIEPGTQAPLDLLKVALELDVKIQKYIHQWTTETKPTSTLEGKGDSTVSSRRSSVASRSGLSSANSFRIVESQVQGVGKRAPSLGLKWEDVGFSRPTEGTEIENEALAEALVHKTEFTRADFNKYRVQGLSQESYIRAENSKFFQPASLPPQEANDVQRFADILDMQGIASDLADGVERLRWRQKICGLIAHCKDHDCSSLQHDLHAVIETRHRSNAASIASRILASAVSSLDVLKLMDDRQRLMEVANEQAMHIGNKRREQDNRWKGFEHIIFHGWYVRVIGSWGTNDLQFRDPCGVAIGPNGHFWVADRGNHRIHHLDASGKALRAIGYRGKIEGQLENPSGVALSPDGNSVFVADRGNDRVAVFNLDGACTGIIGAGTGKEQGYMQGPCAVAMNKQGELAVCDYGNNRIQIFDPKGACIKTFGDGEGGKHRLHQPSAVCYNGEGRIVVADYGNHRVVVFGEDGKVCRELKGGRGGDGEETSFNGPSAVGVLSNGQLAVADQGNHRVQVFSRDAVLLRSFGIKGDDPGRLYNPRGLAIGDHDLIAIADYGNHRLVVTEAAEQ